MRLITFGCSFTDYAWPTWADIIADDLGCEYENWAMGGGGNQQIARRAMYRASRGITDQDWVMIQWTSISREDRFIGGFWRTEGNVALSPTYRGDFLRDHWDWDNDVINTAHSRITTPLLLGPNLKYEMAMQWDDGDLALLRDSARITDYWQPRLRACDTVPAGVSSLRGLTDDGHPDPQWWLQWVEQKIYPRLGLTLKQRTRDRVGLVQQQIEHTAQQCRNHRELMTRVREIMCQSDWRLNKVKPQSDTLTPGQGSDILM